MEFGVNTKLFSCWEDRSRKIASWEDCTRIREKNRHATRGGKRRWKILKSKDYTIVGIEKSQSPRKYQKARKLKKGKILC